MSGPSQDFPKQGRKNSRTSKDLYKRDNGSDRRVWSGTDPSTLEIETSDDTYPLESVPRGLETASLTQAYSIRGTQNRSDGNPGRRTPLLMAPALNPVGNQSYNDGPWFPPDSATAARKHTAHALERLDEFDLQFPGSCDYIAQRQEGYLRPSERASPEYYDDEDDWYYVTTPRQVTSLPQQNEKNKQRGKKLSQEKK